LERFNRKWDSKVLNRNNLHYLSEKFLEKLIKNKLTQMKLLAFLLMVLLLIASVSAFKVKGA